MNIPNLIGYFRYPTLADRRTRGYFAAFPALLPVSAILEYSGTNPFVSATAVFDGQSIPVIATFGRLEAKFSTRLQDIGRQIDLQWTLRFAQDPTVINYTHRVIVTGADAVDPIPTLTGNPCNIACNSQSIDATGYANPLYFATTSISTEYEGFTFSSNLLDNNVISDWCSLNAAGFIDIAPYTIPPYVGTPIWQERNRFCLQSVPRTTSDAVVVEIDTNFNSPTFGQTRTLTVTDATLCPVGSTAPDWQDIGLPECQPEPRTDCRKQVEQRDENPLSPTFGQTQIIILPATPTDCEDCPPTSLLPDYQDTGEWRCVQPAFGRETTLAEKRQIDRNPYSATYNNDQWVSIGLRPDLCPIDTNPNNREVWVDVLNPDCSNVTRCKFDPPRYESTRQKQQIQSNSLLPNFGTIRWVDLPPSPQDAIDCPIDVAPILVPVCPEQVRCKFAAPRFSAMTERLEVDVNPYSATFGQQIWTDYVTNITLCPIDPSFDENQISLHFRGNDAFRVVEMTEKMTTLQVFNIFSNATGVNYKYAPLHGVPDWNVYPNISLAQLQTEIDNGTNIYSVRVSVSGFAQGTDSGLVLTYTVPAGTPPPPTYATVGISQDFIVWHKDDDVVYNSVTTINGSTLSYGLITSPIDGALVNPSFTTLGALNAAIAALTPGSQYGVLIYVAYSGANTTDTLTITTTIP